MKKQIYLNLIILLSSALSVQAKDLKFFYDAENFISYEVIGKGSSHLVFIHGFGSSKASWDEFVSRVDTSKHTLFLVDLKGFGHSSIPKDGKYAIKDHALIIQQFINKKIGEKFVLIGHSYGGGIALFLTSQKMVSPQKLVVIDGAAYNWDTPFFIKGLRTPIVNRMAYWLTTPRLMVRIGIHYIVHKQNNSRVLIDRYSGVLKGKRKPYSHIQAARQINPTNYDSLIQTYKDIDIPTLILWGEDDKILSLAQGKELHNQIQHSEFQIIKKCGHVPHEELPDESYLIIQSFIDKH